MDPFLNPHSQPLHAFYRSLYDRSYRISRFHRLHSRSLPSSFSSSDLNKFGARSKREEGKTTCHLGDARRLAVDGVLSGDGGVGASNSMPQLVADAGVRQDEDGDGRNVLQQRRRRRVNDAGVVRRPGLDAVVDRVERQLTAELDGKVDQLAEDEQRRRQRDAQDPDCRQQRRRTEILHTSACRVHDQLPPPAKNQHQICTQRVLSFWLLSTTLTASQSRSVAT